LVAYFNKKIYDIYNKSMRSSYMSIEENIYNLRKKNNLSQGDLALKMDVSRQSISKWETGLSVPDLKNIIKLSDIFDVTVDEIVKDKNINENKKTNNDLEDKIKIDEKQKNKSLGSIFMAVGALISIMSIFIAPVGVLIGVPIFIFGIEIILIKRNIKLVIAWTALICFVGVFNPWMTSVPSTIGIYYSIKNGFFHLGFYIGIFQRVAGIILLIITIKTLKRNRKEKT
jgi:transcriptional regulator with XRE-family HTH domain